MGTPEGVHVCRDGKTVRGSKEGDVSGHHLVAAYAPAAQAVLAPLRVDAKTNEHKAALQLLGIVPVQGCIFTGDAAFCQRDLCEQIIDGGGDYVLAVKDNQPGLAIDIAAGLAFEDQKRRQAAAFPPYAETPPAADAVTQRVDKGHGRIERRSIRLTTILTKTQQWKGLKQGLEWPRERTEKGRTPVEGAYGITSLSRERADAQRLLALPRGQWGIENGSPDRRDVTLASSPSRCVKGLRRSCWLG